MYARPDLSLTRMAYAHTRKSISPFERLLTVVGGVVNQSNKVPNNIYRLDASSCRRRRIKHDRDSRTVLFFSPFFFLIYRYTFLASSLYAITYIHIRGECIILNIIYIYTHYDDLSTLRMRSFKKQ